MRNRTRAHSQQPSDVIGVVWVFPTYEASTAMIAEAARANFSPGARIRQASFLTMSDEYGCYVVSIGLGFMFSSTFLADCNRLVQKYDGLLFPTEEGNRKKVLITKTYQTWRKVLKRERNERILQNRKNA